MDKTQKSLTLSDSDIASTPNMSRRSLLSTLGLGAAAAALIGSATPAAASDPARGGRACGWRWRDRDPGDRARRRRRCGITDND